MSSKQTAKRRIDYPMGSISSGTMREQDLVPAFLAELEWLAGKTRNSPVPRKTRAAHYRLFREIDARTDENGYYESEYCQNDLELLTDALQSYAAPYFYFGAHPGDGALYGFWLSESWDEDFVSLRTFRTVEGDQYDHLKVSDLSEVPYKFRGEVAVVNDHGNVSLYVKTSRGMREIWSVV